MEAVEGMELLELRTPKLLYLGIDECYHESLRVSAPRLEDLTYVCNRAFIHGPLPRVWRLKISSPIRRRTMTIVPSVHIYLVRLRHLFALSVSHSFNLLALLDAKFKSDLLLTIFLFLLLNCICCF